MILQKALVGTVIIIAIINCYSFLLQLLFVPMTAMNSHLGFQNLKLRIDINTKNNLFLSRPRLRWCTVPTDKPNVYLPMYSHVNSLIVQINKCEMFCYTTPSFTTCLIVIVTVALFPIVYAILYTLPSNGKDALYERQKSFSYAKLLIGHRFQ